MLSILIPVYNYNVEILVQKLINQIRNNSIVAEILILEDGSDQYKEDNYKLDSYSEVQYFDFNNNKGRSFARNFLADKAHFDYLLFIDCDAKVIDNEFLNKYIYHIENKSDVTCGGLSYQERENVPKKYYLRWLYGIKREQKPATKRNMAPHTSFSSFNFMIRRDIFQGIRFLEQINTYGHEDTYFGIMLKEKGFKIKHIDNPLLHDGLEDANEFLKKTEDAVKNLDNLIKLSHDKRSLFKEIRLVKYILLVQKFKLVFLLKLKFKIFKKVILKNLKSQKPILPLLDFYKLGVYFFLK